MSIKLDRKAAIICAAVLVLTFLLGFAAGDFNGASRAAPSGGDGDSMSLEEFAAMYGDTGQPYFLNPDGTTTDIDGIG